MYGVSLPQPGSSAAEILADAWSQNPALRPSAPAAPAAGKGPISLRLSGGFAPRPARRTRGRHGRRARPVRGHARPGSQALFRAVHPVLAGISLAQNYLHVAPRQWGGPPAVSARSEHDPVGPANPGDPALGSINRHGAG